MVHVIAEGESNYLIQLCEISSKLNETFVCYHAKNKNFKVLFASDSGGVNHDIN